jgi:tape measure domain-containing protein
VSADFVIKTEINSSAAKTGADVFEAATQKIDKSAATVKESVAAMQATISGSLAPLATQIQALAAQFAKLATTVDTKSPVAQMNTLKASVEATMATLSKATLGNLARDATNAAKSFNDLAAAMAKVHATTTNTGKTGTTNVMSAASATAGITELSALADAFGSKSAKLAGAVGLFNECILLAVKSVREFAVSSVSARSAFNIMVEGAQAAIAPVGFLANHLAALNVRFTGLKTAADDIFKLSLAAQTLAGSSTGLAAFATAIAALRESVARMSFKSAIAQLESLQLGLSNTGVFDAAATAFDKLTSSLRRLGTVGASAIEGLSAKLGTATTGMMSFAAAINSIKSDVFKTIATELASISGNIAIAVAQFYALASSANNLGPSLAKMQSTIGAVDFKAFAKSAGDALAPVKAMADQLERMASKLQIIVAEFNRLGAIVRSVERNIGTALGMAERVRDAVPAATPKASAGLAGTLNNFGTAQMKSGLADLAASAGLVFTALGKVATVSANVGGAFHTAGSVARGYASALGTLAAASLSAVTGAARLTASLTAFVGGKIVSGIASIANTIKQVGVAMLGIGSIQSLASVFSPSAIAATSDSYMMLSKRIQAVTADQAQANEMTKIATDIAQTYRMPIEEVTRNLAKWYEIQHPLGASINDVADLMRGTAGMMAKAGANTQDFNAAMVQMTNVLATGQMSLQGLRSFMSHDPLLMSTIAATTGKTLQQVRIEMQKTGEVSKLAGAQFAGAVAESGRVGNAMAANIPRSIGDAITQIKNQWIMTIGAIQKDTGFVDVITSAMDRLRETIAGPNMQAALGKLIAFGADIIAWTIEWIASLDNIPAKLESLAVKFQNLGTIIKKSLWDATFGGDNAAKFMQSIDDRINTVNKAKGSSPYGGAFDPVGADKARTQAGLDAMAKDFTFKVPMAFDSVDAKMRAGAVLDSIVGQAKTASVQLHAAIADGVKITPDGLASLDRGIEKIRLMRDQVQTGKISDQLKTDLVNTVESVQAQISAANTLVQGQLTTIETETARIRKNIDGMPYGAIEADKLEPLKAKLEANAVAAESLKAQLAQIANIVASLSGANLGNLVAGINVPNVAPVDPSRRVAVGENLKSVAKGAGAGGGPDKIKTLKAEIELLQAELTGDKALTREAKTQLEIQKAVKDAIAAKHPEQAKEIELLIRQRELLKEQKELFKTFQGLGQQIGNAISDAFMNMAKSGASFKDTLKLVTAQILEMTVKTLILKPIIDSIGRSMGSMGSSLGGSGFADFLVNGLKFEKGGAFSGGAAVPFASPFATGGAFGMPSPTPFANGGAFTNQVVSQPTFFAMGGVGGGGLGVMGEAGPEAIMPLTRGSDGHLGVRAQGSGGSVHHDNRMTFNVAGDLTDETRQRIMADVHSAIDQRTGGIVNQSAATVQRRYKADSKFLSR